MVGITSAFANPSEKSLIEERAKDIIVGEARVLFCRVRGGWAMIGGDFIKDQWEAIKYATKINQNAILWSEQNAN